MAANEDPKDIAATDKAYESAVQATAAKPAEAADAPIGKAKTVKPSPAAKPAVTVKEPTVVKPIESAPVAPVVPAAVEAAKPVEAKVEAKPAPVSPAVVSKAPVKPAAAKPAVAKVPAVAKAVAKPKPAAKPVSKIKPAVKAKPKPAAQVIPVKAATPKPAVKVARQEEKPVPAIASPKAATPKAAKTADKTAFAGFFTNFMLEDTKMDMSTNFSGFQDAMTEAQTKAKDAFEKGTKMMGDVSDFTKGNVEAVIESGKILAEGVQGIGSELVTESRSAFETLTGDIKELAAAKSPTDFFKIQGDMMRKNFDSAVAYGSKNSEAMLKLMSDVMAPLSGRVSLAMEKARSAAVI